MRNDLNSKLPISRRKFIKGAAGASAAAALLGQPMLGAAQNSFSQKNAKRKLFIVHLSGGNDSVNTLVPYTSTAYYASRPTISLHEHELIKVNGLYAFNSAMKEVAELYKKGMVAAFTNTGCRDGLTMSHERASEIWRTAKPHSIECDDWFSSLEGVLMTTIDGFDTHADQKETQNRALRRLSRLVDRTLNENSDTLVLVYSEFGRSIEENEMAGTEHGGNGLTLVIGSSVRGGVYDAEIDFRQVYKTLALNWFQSSKTHTIANDSFDTLAFV